MIRERDLRVFIIEDQEEVRFGLTQLVGGANGFSCTGDFGDMESALDALPNDLPDLILTDIGLPGMSGIEGIRKIKSVYPELPILILSVYDDDEQIIDGICAGASGYLLKSTPLNEIVNCLNQVAEGGAPMSPSIALRVMQLFRESPPPKKVDYDLTPHESRVLKFLVDGHTYKKIGEELGITVNTVSFHIKQIYQKLQVHSKSEAVAKALKNRLV